MTLSLIEQRVEELIADHGGLRAAARALRFDVAHLSRLRDGVILEPTDAVLNRLGLRRIITYARTRT